MVSEGESGFFGAFTATEQQTLRELLRPRHFAVGATILRQGQLSGALHVIQRGLVVVTTGDNLGNTAELARLGPGQFVGEMSILTGQPHSASVTALTPTDTLVLARDDFLALLGRSPRLVQNVLRVLSERLLHTSRRQLAAQQATAVAVESPFNRAAGPALALNLAISLARQARGRVLLVVDEATLAGPVSAIRHAALPALEEVARDPGA